jgi:hypothetical protein
MCVRKFPSRYNKRNSNLQLRISNSLRTVRNVRKVWNRDKFPHRRNSRRGLVEWAPRSPDFSSLELTFWGFLKAHRCVLLKSESFVVFSIYIIYGTGAVIWSKTNFGPTGDYHPRNSPPSAGMPHFQRFCHF